MSAGLEEEHEALLQFLYMAPVGLVQTRHDGEVLMINPLCAQLLMPLSRDGGLSNLFSALGDVAPDLRHRVAQFDAPHGMVCDSLQIQLSRGQSGDREPRILSLSLLKLDAERLMGLLSDVTQSVKRDRALRQSQAWIHSIVTGISDYALLSLDEQGRIRDWNPAVERMTGYSGAALVGQPFSRFYPADAVPAGRLQDRLHEADANGWSLDEGWRLRADGSRYWGSCLIAPLHGPGEEQPDERAYSLILRDISDRRAANEEIRRSLTCDHLTGLLNRRAFFDAAEPELQRWRRRPRPLALVMVDADHFKQVNDRHGHAAGDAVLRHLAAGMRATFRAMDLIARMGGEEFAVLLPDTTAEGAQSVAQRLCERIARQQVDVDGQTISYTVSAGVSAMDADVADLESLLKRADEALYRAKAGGRNRVELWCAGPAAR
ncbi:MAG: diguanylate cyclase [Comamonadaceae bacterium]|nr:diguanylate cyclase [Comamonadaceae bacterium]